MAPTSTEVDRAQGPHALLDRLCKEVAERSIPRPSFPWIVQAVRWGVVSGDQVAGLRRDDAYQLTHEIAPFLDASTARALLAGSKRKEARLRAALLARLVEMGALLFVTAYLGAQTLDEQAELLARLQPTYPPLALLGAAFLPLKEALVRVARERAAKGWTSLLFTVLPLLDAPEREALVEWAVGDPTVLAGLQDEEVIPLAMAGLARRAVARALAVEGAYPRAIALHHVAAAMPDDHPDRETLARAQLDLLKLPRSSQPSRMWRNQLLNAPLPAGVDVEARALLDAWPREERAVALLAWARHTPELRADAFDALGALRPEAATLGALLHFDLLPKDSRGDVFRRGRELALAWESRGEEPEELRATMLFLENSPLDAAALWTLVARCAPDRAAATDALAHAETCRLLGAHGALVELAIAAVKTLDEGDVRRRAVAAVAEVALSLLDLPQRLKRLASLGKELPEKQRALSIALLRRAVEAESPADWLERALRELPALPRGTRDPLFASCVERVLGRQDEPRSIALLQLAEHADTELRCELLSLALSEIAAGPPVGSYPLFRVLRPEDPWVLHERLAALLDHTAPGMDLAHLCSCLAASQPASRRRPMIDRALSGWEERGLVQFDNSEIPTEDLWPVIDRADARRILALCLERRDDDGAELCLSGLLGHLARLGEDPAALALHLAAISTPCLRIDALVDLAPGLSPREVTAEIFAALTATANEGGRVIEILDVLSLLPGIGVDDRRALLDELERQLCAHEDVIRGVRWDTLFDGLLAVDEGARAERWLVLAGTSDAAVEGHLSLAARLPGGDPRRTELVLRAEEIGERLDMKEQRWLRCKVEGREALISVGWACRMVDRKLNDEPRRASDLVPWMPVARRALGNERLARFVAFLATRPGVGQR